MKENGDRLFENNRFEKNSLKKASTPTGYCRSALPHVKPQAGYTYVQL